MTMASRSFSKNDEVSVQNSIKDLVNIFMRGSGSANLSLEINDGVCDLKLTYRLGTYPSRNYSSSSRCANQTSQPNKRKGKKKSPSQRARDSRRAEAFRLRKTQESEIIIPISGQLLPINNDVKVPCGHSVKNAEKSSPDSSLLPDPPEAPLKSNRVAQILLNDDNSAKKNLFPAAAESSSVTLLTTETQTNGLNPSPQYQKREEELWCKLFK